MAHIDTLTTDQLKALYAQSADAEAVLSVVAPKKAGFYKRQKKAVMALIEQREPVADMSVDELLDALQS